MSKVRMNNTGDIRRTLQKVSDMVIDGSIDTKQANCVIYACQTALSVIKTEELVKDNEDRRNSPFNNLFADLLKD